MAEERLSVSVVLRAFLSLGSAHGGYLALVTAAISAGFIALDLVTDGMGSALAGFVVGIFGQVLVVERLLADRLPAGRGHRRYGAMFSSTFLGGLGILAGLVALVIPGLVLIAAWSASTAFVVAEGRTGPRALGASWDATRGSRLPLTLLVAAGLAATIFAMVLVLGARYAVEGAASLMTTSNSPGVVEIVGSDIVTSGFTVANWLFGAAVYRLLVPASEGMDEIFA